VRPYYETATVTCTAENGIFYCGPALRVGAIHESPLPAAEGSLWVAMRGVQGCPASCRKRGPRPEADVLAHFALRLTPCPSCARIPPLALEGATPMLQAISFWADLATVLLVLEGMVLLAIPGATCYFAGRGVRWLLQNGRPFFRRVRGLAEQAREATETASAAVAGPVIQARSFPAWVRGVWRGLRGVERHWDV